MSWLSGNDPIPGDKKSCNFIETVIVPRARDLGGFEVRRALPSSRKQMIGPFIFFDQMGPAEFITGQGIDVRPHPHIGLATLTYLINGTIMHRDSLGTEQVIKPNEVNLMTAGQGISHSERTDDYSRAQESMLFGLQSWIALPKKDEETAPNFSHHDKTELPELEAEGKNVRLIAGTLFGKTSPVHTYSDMFYADCTLNAGASLPLDAAYEERAAYVLQGTITIAGDAFEAGQLLVFHPGDQVTITAQSNARIMLMGGEPMDGPRHIWWNFVSSSKERIEQAKEDWKNMRFDAVPGDSEFIPLPDL
ncbi:MAG: pirin family protein [Pseudomonadota bacterium]